MKKLLLVSSFASLFLADGTLAADAVSEAPSLPSLAQVQPLGKSPRLFNNIRFSSEGIFTWIDQKAGQPARLNQQGRGVRLGLSTDIGDVGFAEISGRFSSEEWNSRVVSFPLDLNGDGQTRGVDGMIGFKPMEHLRIGVIGGVGDGDLAYSFAVAPSRNPSSSFGSYLGAFAGGSHELGDLGLHVDLSYLNAKNKQTYAPTNSVQEARWNAEFMALQFGASYNLTPKLKIAGSLALHHVLSQTVAPAETPLDTSWGSAQLRMGYMLTDQLELNAKGVAWFENSKYDYRRVSLGMSYRF